MRFREYFKRHAEKMRGRIVAQKFCFGSFLPVTSEEFHADIGRAENYWRSNRQREQQQDRQREQQQDWQQERQKDQQESVERKRRIVAIAAENSYSYLVQLFGLIFAEEIAVPLNQNMDPEELAYFLRMLDADVLLTDEDLAEELRDRGLSEGLSVRLLDDAFADTPYRGKEETAIAEEDTVLMLLSSGTSGKSKAVQLSQQNLAASSGRLYMECEDRQEKVLQALPIYHIGGIILSIEELLRGNLLVVSSAKYYMLQVQADAFDKLILVPAMAENLLKKAEADAALAEGLKPVSKILCVGAPLMQDTVRRMREHRIDACVYYGLTETTGTVSCDGAYRDGACGIVGAHNEVRIVDGEIVIRGANVTKGYYRNEEETAKVLRDGWLYTGDLGEIDADGYLFLRGRSKNIILLSNGENVSPEELEEKLLPCPAIEEVLVCGLNGEIAARVYCGEDLPAEEIDREGDCCRLSPAEELDREGDRCRLLPAGTTDKGDDGCKLSSAEEAKQDAVRAFVRELNRTLPTTKKIKRLLFSDTPLPKTGLGKIKRNGEDKAANGRRDAEISGQTASGSAT